MPFQIPLYSLTLFLSALLLFSAQPLVGKMILPLLGGSPSVWNTAMVFFQLLLLGGYAYAHALAKFFPVRLQVILHAALIAIAAASLPLVRPTGIPEGNPLLWQLSTMIPMIAAPFFALSASAPLFQHWFAKSGHTKSDNPYFLYVASNAGSMIALLGYPFLFEPTLTVSQQSFFWMVGYGVLFALTVLCGLLAKPSAAKPEAPLEDSPKPERKTILIWLLLAFCPSSLMLGFTTYVTTDIASVPLFWVVPLALYLLTFIIAFSEKPIIPLLATRMIQAIVMLVFIGVLMLGQNTGHWTAVALHALMFFFTTLLCHQELAALKPKAKHLTLFFLILSLGGALGGIFNALIAPLIFNYPIEYILAIVLALYLRHIDKPEQNFKGAIASLKTYISTIRSHKMRLVIFPGMMVLAIIICYIPHFSIGLFLVSIFAYFTYIMKDMRWAFALTLTVALICNKSMLWMQKDHVLAAERNFFGVLRVYDRSERHILYHGTTVHGAQLSIPKYELMPITYYYPETPVGDIFPMMPLQGDNQYVAAIGLGVGSIACYRESRRHFDFYEIDEDVVKIAENPKLFTYLSGCGSKYTVTLGDGRLKIAQAPDHKYDIIFVDAFSSDNIPMHLLTKEAFEIYKAKLKQNGLLVVHISNRFFFLRDEVALLGKQVGLKTLYNRSKGGDIDENDDTPGKFPATMYTVLTEDPTKITHLLTNAEGWEYVRADETLKPWSDDYSNILRAFNFMHKK